MNFNASNFSKSTQLVSTKLNLSQLILTGAMTSVGINNSSAPIVSSQDISLTGNAKLSMQTGAVDGRFLRCDGTGLASWATLPNTYDANTNKTILQGITETSGINNSLAPITSSQDISLTSDAKLKYPSGVSGRVLTSDASGNLTLQQIPVQTPILNIINAVLSSGNIFNGVNPSSQLTTIGSITLTAGTWLVYHRLGFFSTTGVILNGRAITNISNGLNPLTDSQGVECYSNTTIPASSGHLFGSHQFITTLTQTTALNIRLQFTLTVSTLTATTSNSICYALRIA